RRTYIRPWAVGWQRVTCAPALQQTGAVPASAHYRSRDISAGDIAQCKRAHGSRGRKPVLTGSEYVSRAARKFPDSAVLIAGALGYGIGYADPIAESGCR